MSDLQLWQAFSSAARAVLIMSVTGGVIALLLFALKPVIKNRIPKSVQYGLWAVVLIAFLVPFSSFVSFPIRTPLAQVQRALEENVISAAELQEELSQTKYGVSYEELDELEKINIYYPEIGATQASFQNYIVTVVTMTGPIVFLIELVQYFAFILKLRKRRSHAKVYEKEALQQQCQHGRQPRIYRNPLAPTPMLVGIFQPIIYLPEREYTDAQLQNILCHELAHLRRNDVIVKWIAAFAVRLHWFNPLAWLARREIDRACELACDEAVIKNLDNGEKQIYGDTLIAMAADTKKSKMIVSTTMCEEKKTLKTRLGAIMQHKRFSSWAIAASFVVMVAVLCGTVVLGASAQSETAAEFFIHQYRSEAAVFRPVSILAERTLEDETILLFYLNAKGNLGCAVVQNGMLGYKLMGTSSELAIEGKSPAQVMCSSLHTGKWLAWGILRDDAIESAAFYEQEITIVEADNLRLCYATGDGYIPDDHSFMFFDSSGNVVWDMMASSFSKAMTVYIWREQDSIKYALFDSAKVDRTEENIKNSELIFSAVSELNAAIADHAMEGMHLYIQYDMNEFTKEEMDAISDQFKVPVGNYSTSTGAIRVQ